MNREEFRKIVYSPIEEITQEEYINRDCNLDFKIDCTDGNLYYKPRDREERNT